MGLEDEAVFGRQVLLTKHPPGSVFSTPYCFLVCPWDSPSGGSGTLSWGRPGPPYRCWWVAGWRQGWLLGSYTLAELCLLRRGQPGCGSHCEEQVAQWGEYVPPPPGTAGLGRHLRAARGTQLHPGPQGIARPAGLSPGFPLGASPSQEPAEVARPGTPDGEPSSPTALPGVPAPVRDPTAHPGVPPAPRGNPAARTTARPSAATPRMRSRARCRRCPHRAGALRREDGGARGPGAEEGTTPSAVGSVFPLLSPGRCLPGTLLP